jgi:hypothetical protein
LNLIFPESTAVFDTGRRPMHFVHGGNSLQERVIPVLTLVHRAGASGSTVRYIVHAAPREGVAGMHCLEVRVEVTAQRDLDFGGVREVELGLRVPEAPEVRAELCQTRGGARLSTGSIVATVGEKFERFFRLIGATDDRVLVELRHLGADAEIVPCVVDGRFAVTARGVVDVSPSAVAAHRGLGWLEGLPEPGIRKVFEHLAAHGVVTETEAAAMLGGPRALRRFALKFEEYTAKAPFGVRIDVIAGVKRYVREGAS